MINALTSSRIEVAYTLEKMRKDIMSIRSNICLTNEEITSMEYMVEVMDLIINRVMNVKIPK